MSKRIGHFVADGAEQKARLCGRDPKQVDLFWLPAQTSNQQWSLMIHREMPVSNWTRYVDDWNRRLPGGERHCRPSTYTKSRDKEGLYYRYDSRFSFTTREDHFCRSWLSSLGWSDGEPVACALVRDSAYLEKHDIPREPGQASKRDWSYHDYRDANIFNFLPALQWLAEKGVWVFRMGKLMREPLCSNHPRIVDYAFSEDKSDLLDVWLFANCSFCISTSTGPDVISTIYRRPILYLNASPLGHLTSYSHSVWVPKNLSWAKDNKPLQLKEYLSHTYFNSQQYQEAGLRLQELSEREILEHIQEFWGRFHQTWEDSEADLSMQHKFWQAFEHWEDYEKWHGWRHPDAGVATTWLRRQGKDFFD